jgi:L-alanine-DL-glutamate epimerase-like enolase superfamily enzyme
MMRRVEHEVWIVPLRLRHPFGLSRGTASELPTVLLRLGGRGLGEAAPVRYLGHDAEGIRRTLSAICADLKEHDLEDRLGCGARTRSLAPDLAPVRAAVDIALWDLAARARGRSLRDEVAATASVAPVGPGARETAFTIALDGLDAMAERAAEASHMPRLKIKLGKHPDFDRAAVGRVKTAAPHARIVVDANGGWSLAQAQALLPGLCDLGVELVEQPLARGQLPALAELRRTSPIPIYADEDVQGPESLAALRGCVDGINIKLMKCGGISPALEMIAAARREGWRVLLGCMIESRVGLAAAASLAAHVDELDLDAHLLTVDDPVPPGSARVLTAAPPSVPGAGLGVPLRW